MPFPTALLRSEVLTRRYSAREVLLAPPKTAAGCGTWAAVGVRRGAPPGRTPADAGDGRRRRGYLF